MADQNMTMRLLDLLTGDENRELIQTLREKTQKTERRLDSIHAEELEANLETRYASYTERGADPAQISRMEKRYERRIEKFGTTK